MQCAETRTTNMQNQSLVSEGEGDSRGGGGGTREGGVGVVEAARSK
jgi:hypothetical protein